MPRSQSSFALSTSTVCMRDWMARTDCQTARASPKLKCKENHILFVGPPQGGLSNIVFQCLDTSSKTHRRVTSESSTSCSISPIPQRGFSFQRGTQINVDRKKLLLAPRFVFQRVGRLCVLVCWYPPYLPASGESLRLKTPTKINKRLDAMLGNLLQRTITDTVYEGSK